MLTQAQSLMEAIGKGMLRSTPESAWESIRLQLSGVGRMLHSALAVISADGTVNTAVEIDDDTEDACADLRDAMFLDGVGTWYNALLTVDSNGKFESEFDYDNPPLDGHANSELLEEDQQEYPRDQEHLPDWHPSKAAG